MALARRLLVSLVVSAIFGILCAYGTSNVQIPGFTMTMPYLMTIFYARLLTGFLIGFAGSWAILKSRYGNAALRGAIMGIISSVSISFYGGAAVFIGAGIIYGIITDVLATKFGE
ncbi:MAG: hypothetical protein FJY76_00445 [Candidatus Aenigmarchaeota archaeon]|nr:hypothetical protein [Candidatus Aenigmarchaeota archaeon]